MLWETPYTRFICCALQRIALLSCVSTVFERLMDCSSFIVVTTSLFDLSSQCCSLIYLFHTTTCTYVRPYLNNGKTIFQSLRMHTEVHSHFYYSLRHAKDIVVSSKVVTKFLRKFKFSLKRERTSSITLPYL
mgnify:FL=1